MMDPFAANCGGGVVTAASLLLGGSGGVDGGIFHRITMTSMTGAWYLTINNFEAIIVGLVILEIFVLRYLLILPLDFTKWIEQGILLQTAVLRRRKRDLFPRNGGIRNQKKGFEEEIRLMDTMFTVVRRLDKEDCLLKGLCELERERIQGCGQIGGGDTVSQPLNKTTLPLSVIRTLLFLKGFQPPQPPLEKNINWLSPVMSQLQGAVRNGAFSVNTTESTGCGHHYPKCALSQEEIHDQLQIYLRVLANWEE